MRISNFRAPESLSSRKPPAPLEAGPVDPTDQVDFATHGALRGSASEFFAEFQKQMGLSEASLEERKAMMASSPAMLFRMYPALFIQDLQGPYQQMAAFGKGEPPEVMLSGDCHLGNLGSLRGRKGVRWTLNDFDQAGVGSPAIDLARLAVSIRLAGDGRSVAHMLHHYRAALERIRRDGPALEPGFTEANACPPVSEFLKKMGKRSQEELLARYTLESKQLKRNEELGDVDADTRRLIEGQLPCPLLDLAAKRLSGGSSRGLPRYYALVQDPQQSLPALVEIKAILPSPLDGIQGDPHRADPDEILRRQERLGTPRRPWDGSMTVHGLRFQVREREREKGDIDPAGLSREELDGLCAQAGTLLGQMHARSSSQAGRILKWSENDDFEKRVRKFSATYVKQVEEDFKAL